MKSYAQVMEEILQLQAKADELHRKITREDVVNRMKVAMSFYEINPDELSVPSFEAVPVKRGRKSKKHRKMPPRQAYGFEGQVWKGFGRKPEWLKLAETTHALDTLKMG